MEDQAAVRIFLRLVLHHLEVDLVTEVPAQSQAQDQDQDQVGDVEEDMEAAQDQDMVGDGDGDLHIPDQEVMALLVF